MQNTPRFATEEWDLRILLVTIALALLCFAYSPLLSLVISLVGIALLFLRLRNANRYNAEHDFGERIPTGSKLNRSFFLILSYVSFWLSMLILFRLLW